MLIMISFTSISLPQKVILTFNHSKLPHKSL
uniref:Uncharacterized protein n=1 Tax=Rhizophora mucronata TaxID=61149 RepID=A0A2P2NGT9_RHIMU